MASISLNLLVKCFDSLLGNYLSLSQICFNYLDSFIPKNTIEIKQAILHPHYPSSCCRTLDITSEIPAKLNSPNLSSLMDKANKIYSIESNLEIIYYWQEKIFRIVYEHNEPIVFPPYSIEELKNINQGYANGVLFATYLEQDITDLIKAHAGPKGNFYQDQKITITLNKLKSSLDYRGFLVKDGQPLVITDNYAQDHTFTDEDVLKLED